MKPPPLLSIVMPVYRGAKMLDDTFAQLASLQSQLPAGAKIEIIAIDDGSDDDSYQKILHNQKTFPGRVCAVRLSKNFGANAASHAGFEFAHGDCVANVPQDLQEPPELFLTMFLEWQKGIKINIGQRKSRADPFHRKIIANIYHYLFKLLVVSNYPRGGLCTYLIDRQIVEELRRVPDISIDPATRLFTMGYSCRLHPYNRRATPMGIKSNWSFGKNIKLAIDNFISFSYMPIRLMSMFGFILSGLSVLFALYVILGKTTDLYTINQPPGWATIVTLITLFSGMIMGMLGIIGEYLWRILDLTRKRPVYLIDEVKDSSAPTPPPA